MADNRNFAALDWLIHEISETLKEARQALESYVENPKDAARIRFCLTHIHQVHGSLQMVEFYGAAMLASEMEQLTQAMVADTVANSSEAQEVLMRAILQFPLYLDQVKATRKDNPLVVLPLLNDLRAVRGESLLTDTKLFVPNLTPAKRSAAPACPSLTTMCNSRRWCSSCVKCISTPPRVSSGALTRRKISHTCRKPFRACKS
jgi:chemosensory pili system protein ChpA (sensor histidine kinase/response regulator)